MNIRKSLLAITAFFSFSNAILAYHEPIDTVYSFKPGKGQNVGQDSAYFPANIFKLPPSSASELSPASSATDLCSLGLGGEIVVGFKNCEVINGNGPDFTIFENVMKNQATGKYFIEPAVVSVSSDGVNFIAFPFDSVSFKGCAGIEPTNGSEDPYNPDKSGGDKFDLATLGLSSIKYIKIADICQTLLNEPNNPNYDPTISGFDLDCVVGLNLSENLSINENAQSARVFSENTQSIQINLSQPFSAKIYNFLGAEIADASFNSNFPIEIDKSALNSGVYLLIVFNNNFKASYKFIID